MFDSISELNKAELFSIKSLGFFNNANQCEVSYKDWVFSYSYGSLVSHPENADIIYSLIVDMWAGQEPSINDFMANYGYTDKERAKKDYGACKHNGKMLRKHFTRKQIESFKILLEDY